MKHSEELQFQHLTFIIVSLQSFLSSNAGHRRRLVCRDDTLIDCS